jgi:hypothetical protein
MYAVVAPRGDPRDFHILQVSGGGKPIGPPLGLDCEDYVDHECRDHGEDGIALVGARRPLAMPFQERLHQPGFQILQVSFGLALLRVAHGFFFLFGVSHPTILVVRTCTLHLFEIAPAHCDIADSPSVLTVISSTSARQSKLRSPGQPRMP